MAEAPPGTVFTVGHSTRSLEELAGLLSSHGVELLVDVRSLPASRRMPHFSRARLEEEMPRRDIAYLHLPGLGGRRRPRPGSPNSGWRNASFRAYADHMGGADFQADLERLLELAVARRTAVMCAEAVPWRCHRWLVGDALVARGRKVLHITGPGPPILHRMTPFARVESGRVSYPGPKTEGVREPPPGQ
ncbi:MAG: DUF488 family protein [Candidatus Dormibacterales bacterium]